MADYAEQLQQDATEEKAQISQDIAEVQANRAKRREVLEKDLASKQAEYEQLKTQKPDTLPVPKFTEPPKAPNTQEMLKPTSLQKQFGLASIFALLSVGLAKGSAIYGLKAMGGFMEGAHASNVEQAKAALDDYNSNMRTVHEANEAALHEYNAIFQNTKLSWDAKLQTFREKALMFEDRISIEKLDQGDMNAVHGYHRDLANVNKAMHTELLRNEQIKLQMQKFTGQGGADTIFGVPMVDIPAGQPGQKNEAFLEMLPPARAEVIRKIAAGNLDVRTMGGMGAGASQMRRNYNEAAALYDPNYKQQRYGVIDKALKDLTPGGRVGTNVTAMNTVAEHIDQWGDAFSKLNNSQIRAWNSTKNKLSSEFGDPALKAVQVPAKLVAAETARILRGGNASPTKEEIAEWEEILDTANSPGQTKTVQWELIKGVGGRIRSLEDQERKTLQDPNFEILTPEVKGLIKKFQPKGAPTPSWLGGGDKPDAKPTGKPASKVLTYEEAQAIFKEAGGDKNKAREIARQRGKEF